MREREEDVAIAEATTGVVEPRLEVSKTKPQTGTDVDLRISSLLQSFAPALAQT